MSRSDDRVICRALRSVRIGDRRTFTADVKLYSYGGQAPHFSATGEERNLRRRGDEQVEACGTMHDEIVRYFPELAPVVRVHLSGADGTPMHAVANGLYWLGLLSIRPDDPYGRTPIETDAHGRDWSPTVAASHFRVDDAEVRAIRAEVLAVVAGRIAERADRSVRDELEQALTEVLAAHDMPARWQAEADAAVAVMERAS